MSQFTSKDWRTVKPYICSLPLCLFFKKVWVEHLPRLLQLWLLDLAHGSRVYVSSFAIDFIVSHLFLRHSTIGHAACWRRPVVVVPCKKTMREPCQVRYRLTTAASESHLGPLTLRSTKPGRKSVLPIGARRRPSFLVKRRQIAGSCMALQSVHVPVPLARVRRLFTAPFFSLVLAVSPCIPSGVWKRLLLRLWVSLLAGSSFPLPIVGMFAIGFRVTAIERDVCTPLSRRLRVRWIGACGSHSQSLGPRLNDL